MSADRVSANRWLYEHASVVGTSHAAEGGGCQDFGLCRELTDGAGNCVLTAVVADGAGSAERSAEGAELLCRMVVAEVERLFVEGRTVADIKRADVEQLIDRFQAEVEELATNAGLRKRAYACTLAAAVVGESASVFFQIGDSVAVYLSKGTRQYRCAFWPQKGEYENTTYFATADGANEKLEFMMLTERVQAVSLFTDGLLALALQNSAAQAYTPFFVDVFARFEKRKFPIADFLQSDFVNARTDDDKTLILACLPVNRVKKERTGGRHAPTTVFGKRKGNPYRSRSW